MIALLVSTVIVARFSRVKDRKIAVGTAYASLGALITLVGSVYTPCTKPIVSVQWFSLPAAAVLHGLCWFCDLSFRIR